MAAHSFLERELNAVDAVLAKAGISAQYTASKRLLDQRPGRLYRIQADDACKLERLLQVRFVDDGRKTSIEVDGENAGTDLSYHCERVNRYGFGTGCVNIKAPNLEVAIVKCALLAHVKEWFGAVANSGPCSNRGR